MNQRRFVVVLLLVIAAVVGAALWLATRPDDAAETNAAAKNAPAVGTVGVVAEKKKARSERSRWTRVGFGTVAGVVREYGSERPVEGVEVTLEAGTPGPNEKLTAKTRADGGFTFDKVANFDAWTLRAKAPAPLSDAELAGVNVVEDKQTDLGVVYLAPAFGVPGIVVDEKEAPVVGATVSAIRAKPMSATIDLLRLIRELPSRPASVDHAKTGESGKFELRKVPPGTYDFTVEKPGWQIKVEHGVVVTPDAKSRVLKFVVQRGFEVAGTVTRESGGPVGGIKIVAFHEPDQPTEFNALDKSFAVTDEKGAFRVEGLGTGRYVVAVVPEGEPMVAERNVAIPARKSVDIVLKGDAWLEGRVTTDGDRPVADAQIYVMMNITNGGGSPSVGVGRSGPDGRYSMRGLRSGAVEIFFVHADGYGNYPDDPISNLFSGKSSDLKLAPGKNERDVSLGKGAVVRGVVKEKGGDVPIAGARVELTTPIALFGGKQGATTDAQGRFEITSVPKGPAILQATKEGWFQPGVNPQSMMMVLGSRMRGGGGGPTKDPGKGATVVVTTPGETIERTLELSHGSSVTGVVAAPDGTPVAGAQVTLDLEESGDYIARMFGGLFPSPEPRLTDAQGKYELPGPPPAQKACVVARASGWLDGKTAVFSCTAGESKTGADVKLRLGGTLAGRVHDAEGRAVEGAMVRWIPFSGDDVWALQWRLRAAPPTIADSKGEFRIPNVETGKLIVQATEPRHLDWEKSDVVSSEGDTTTIDAVLQLGGVITGKVVAFDGKARTGATVNCSPAPDGMDMEIDDFRSFDGSDRTTSDAAGVFRIEGLAPGRYRLRASAAEAAPSEDLVVDAGGPAVTLRLAEAFAVRGVVRAKSGGAVGDVHVALVKRWTAQTPDGPVEQARSVKTGSTNASGEFDFKEVPAGTYEISVAPGWGPPPRPNIVPTTKKDVTAPSQSVLVEVESGALIGGQVRGEDGEPVLEGWVGAVPAEPKPGVEPIYSQIDDGRFEIAGLLPGVVYRVHVSSGAGQKIVVVPAGKTDVKVEFGGGGSIRVHLLKTGDAPVVGGWVSARNDEGSGQGQTDADGRVEIKGLAAGTYAVHANVDGADVKREGVVVRTGAATDVELHGTDEPK